MTKNHYSLKREDKQMKKNMDTVTFESRCEIQAVAIALMEYISKHPNDGKAETLKELVNLLDVMDMEW